MTELGALRTHLLRKVLPFALTLSVGVAAFYTLSFVRRSMARRASMTTTPAEVARDVPAADVRRELPEVHVLSPMMMDEVLEFERRGGGYEGARVVSPPGPHYGPPPRRDYRQGVLQVHFLFGADGTISEIEPRAKPVDCGICLQGPNVVQIDPRDPRSREFVEAAKEAVGRIRFEPGTNGGRPVAMHGLVECVFRLDGEGSFRLE